MDVPRANEKCITGSNTSSSGAAITKSSLYWQPVSFRSWAAPPSLQLYSFHPRLDCVWFSCTLPLLMIYRPGLLLYSKVQRLAVQQWYR